MNSLNILSKFKITWIKQFKTVSAISFLLIFKKPTENPNGLCSVVSRGLSYFAKFLGNRTFDLFNRWNIVFLARLRNAFSFQLNYVAIWRLWEATSSRGSVYKCGISNKTVLVAQKYSLRVLRAFCASKYCLRLKITSLTPGYCSRYLLLLPIVPTNLVSWKIALLI